MSIDKHISSLLYRFDHVVISGFGAFVCQEFGAEVNEATQMFMPPTKRVIFQSAVKEGSHLLENEIATKANISFDQAKDVISRSVIQWKSALGNGEHVKLEGIGRIYLGSNQEIQFQSELNANFDADSFGLSIYRFPVLKDLEVEDVLRPNAILENVKHQKTSVLWKRVGLVAGLAGLIFIGSHKPDFNSIDFASFNPFKFSRTIEVPIETSIEKKDVATKVIEESAFGTIETKVSELPALYEITESKDFHVIVGAFKVQNNASEFLVKLRNSGFENAEYFYEKGFFRVSANNFSNREEAVNSLPEIKAKIQNGAWIYRR
jgi:nucleoid DNA-binding protein